MLKRMHKSIEKRRRKWRLEEERTRKRVEFGIPMPYLFKSTFELFRRQLKEKHKFLSTQFIFLPSYTRPQRLLLKERT